MATLKEYLNAKIKSKGSTLAKEKAKGKKYKSIAAAKKAGALYYTNKDGKIMAAVYAEDLKKPLAPNTSLRPKARPGSKTKGGGTKPSTKKAPSKTTDRRAEQLDAAMDKPGNEAAKKAREAGKLETIQERAAKRKAEKAKNKMNRGGAMMKKKKKGMARGGAMMMKKKTRR
jgi:hypothetical protein